MTTEQPQTEHDEIEYDLEATLLGRRYLLIAHGDRPGYAAIHDER